MKTSSIVAPTMPFGSWLETKPRYAAEENTGPGTACVDGDARNAEHAREHLRAQHIVLSENLRHATPSAFPCGSQCYLKLVIRLWRLFYRKRILMKQRPFQRLKSSVLGPADPPPRGN